MKLSAITGIVVLNLFAVVYSVATACLEVLSPDGIKHDCPSYEITISNAGILQIICREGWDDLDELNALTNISNIDQLWLDKCPLHSGIFQKLFEKFKIKPSLVSCKDVNSALPLTTLTKNHVKSLEDVNFFKASYAAIENIEENTFEDLSNITILDLENNLLTHIPTALKNIPQLQTLRLSRNKIVSLKGLEYLPNLARLSIDGNLLANIANDAFEHSAQLKFIELSNNKIEQLPTGVLAPLKNLQQISLLGNPVKTIANDAFRNNQMLEEVTVGTWNKRLYFEDAIFANMPSLRQVKILNSDLREIPENTFSNCTSLKVLYLQRLRLVELPDNLFRDLQSLEYLNLQGNFLTRITSSIFKSLPMLKRVHLQENLIDNFHPKAFQFNSELEGIYLSRNQIDFVGTEDLVVTCPKLIELDLHHNKVAQFYSKWFNSSLKTINLSYNLIQELNLTSDIYHPSNEQKVLNIDLRNNTIRTVYFDGINQTAGEQVKNLLASKYNERQVKINLEHNKIECDCKNVNLLRYFHGDLNDGVRSLVNLEENNFYCSGPVQFADQHLQTLNYYDLTCPEIKYCPKNCSCHNSAWDTALLVDCSNRNLVELPRLAPLPSYYNQTYMKLSGNNFNSLPMKDYGYSQVTELNLSNNSIEDVEWLPENIKFLDLRYNKIKHLNNNVLDGIGNNSRLYFSNNPFECTCETLNFTKFLKHHLRVDKKEIACAVNQTRYIIDLEEVELCNQKLTLLLVLGIVVTILFLILAILLAMYYKYNEEIKVYFFSRKMFLWWIRESDLDKDKEFDAFISYSNFDKNFVEDKLVPALESGPKPYKLLLHYRDWVPGTLISKQIINSVTNSKRTVVVVSPNFLKSDWGQLEFKTAHLTAMTEKRPRVVVIMYGALKEKDMPDEFKSYVNTKTYIKWEDAKFWDKLKYNLPHENCFENIPEQKMHNVMSKIDKMDLISIQMVPNSNATTPPIIQDALILKKNPLEFKESDLHITPPAECGVTVA